MRKKPAKAIEARKPILIEDTKTYTMFKIPLNYHSVVKPSMELKSERTGIGRDCYTPLEWGLERAKTDVAEYIADFFRPASRCKPSFGRPVRF